jgi:hypothetical protein
VIRRLLPALALLAALAFAPACEEETGRPTDVPGTAGIETSQLVLALRDVGAAAEVVDIVPAGSGILSAPATRVTVNGALVFVYEFATAAAADAEASRVPDILAVTRWMSLPHFFRGNRLIVLYVGTDEVVTGLLQRLLGPQFAGH